MARRTSRGRQKIEMAKMTNADSLQVTFSKRKKCVFNKANELSILCDAEIALVVFSPGGKAFSFGHPSVQSIIEKYLQNPNNPTDDQRISQNRRNTSLHEMNQLEKQVKEAKKRREALKKAREEDPGKEFWKVPIDELDLEQLSMYAKALQGLKKDVDKEILSHSIKEAGSTSINDMENVLNPVRVRASDELLLAGQVSGGGNSLVVGDEEEGIDLNLTLRPGSGNYLERVGDNRKPIRVYQFI